MVDLNSLWHGTVQDSLMYMILYTMHNIVRSCCFGFENIILSVDVMSILYIFVLSSFSCNVFSISIMTRYIDRLDYALSNRLEYVLNK